MKTLYPFQLEAVERVVSEETKSALIAADMGAGKTLMAVEIVRRLDVKNPTVLVVCPLGTLVSWERTFKEQGLSVPVSRINSKQSGKDAMEKLKSGVPGVYLIGREYFRRHKWTTFKKVGVVIVDEVHIFTNRKSAGFRSLRTLKPEWRISMSGTPWGNRFENAWALSYWLWKPPFTPKGFWEWVAKYAITEPLYLGGKKVIKIVGERNPGKFVSDLPCYIRPNIPPHPVVYDYLYTELTPAQRKMYDHFEEKSYVWLGEQALVEDLPIVERIRLREMALGTVSLDDEGNVIMTDDMKSSKEAVLKEYLASHPDDNVLILTHSKKYAKIIANRIPNSRLWIGETSLEERQELIEGFGTDFKYIIATVSSLAEGVDGLQHNCSTMIWLSRTENDMLNRQVEARIARPTHGNVRNTALCIDIIAENTYDESITDKLYFTHKTNRMSLEGEQ